MLTSNRDDDKDETSYVSGLFVTDIAQDDLHNIEISNMFMAFELPLNIQLDILYDLTGYHRQINCMTIWCGWKDPSIWVIAM